MMNGEDSGDTVRGLDSDEPDATSQAEPTTQLDDAQAAAPEAPGPSAADASAPASDAEASSIPSPDASPLDTATVLPSWGEPLLGTYAARSYSFAQQPFDVMSLTEELSLVHIVRVGGGAELRARLCRQVAQSSQDELRMVDPAGLGEVRRQVLFADGQWSTDPSPWGYGYDRDLPADCIGMEDRQIPKRPAQAWLNSTCRCPGAAEDDPRVDDCRVSDPDRDRNPGMTYTLKGSGPLGFVNDRIHAVYVSRSHHVRGRVAMDRRHYAKLVVDEVAYQLSCGAGACLQIGSASRPCTSDYNGVHFVPVGERTPDGQEWTCERLLARSGELFPDPPPAKPSSCALGVLTDDPMRQ